MLYGGEQIWPAYLSLISEKKMLRARALEFLDNTLAAEVRRDVFAAIDDTPKAEKLERAHKQYGIVVKSKREVLGGFLEPEVEGDSDDTALAAAALYAAHQEEVPGLENEIRDLAATAVDPFVKETASWLVSRLGL